MKPRSLLAILLIAGVAGGLAWWLRQPPAAAEKSASVSEPAELKSMPPASEVSVVPHLSPRTIAPPAASTATTTTSVSSKAAPTGPDMIPYTPPRNFPGLHFVDGPANGPALALAAVKHLGGNHGPALQVSQPFAWYTVGLGSDLKNAKFREFNYIIVDAGSFVQWGVVSAGPTGEGKAEGAGRPVDGGMVLRALDQLTAQTHEGAYEIRLLQLMPVGQANRIPVLWLKADTGDDDLIFTIDASLPGTQSGTLYSVAEFLKISRAFVNDPGHIVYRGSQ